MNEREILRGFYELGVKVWHWNVFDPRTGMLHVRIYEPIPGFDNDTQPE